MADAEECIRLKPDWEKGYFRKGNAFETLAKTEEVRVRPPKLLSHTVHLQRKLTFNFCCRCCCEKGSGGVQDRRGEEPGQQGLLEQGQAAHQGGAEAEGQGRKAEQAKLFLRQQQEEVRRSRNTLCFKVFPSILFFFWCFASERFLYDRRAYERRACFCERQKQTPQSPPITDASPPKGYVGYRFSSTVMLLKSGFL